MTVDLLPNELLLDIFDFYQVDASDPSGLPWRWHTLVHVCQRWRQIVFASPGRLDLQLVCTPRTRVKELLDSVPPMPIVIFDSFEYPPPDPTPSLGDGSQIVPAFEQYDSVCCIQLGPLPSVFLEKITPVMQQTFPNLEHLGLWAGDASAPVLPDSFLGGSAPLLEILWLKGIPFPGAPKLLSTTPNLVQLQLENIPDSGFFSPEAMITSLSTCPNLESLVIGFLSPYPHPDLTSQQSSMLTRASLPDLINFGFKGNGGYLRILAPGIENVLLTLDSTILSVDKSVNYEASLTSSGFKFSFQDDRLEDLGEEA